MRDRAPVIELLMLVALSLPSCRQWSAEGEPSTFALPAQQPFAESSIVMDLGSEGVGAFGKAGFFTPEKVGTRRASWSSGARSELTFDLKPADAPYVVSWLAEPYAAIAPVAVQLALNGKQVWSGELKAGWHGYAIELDPGSLRKGSNELTLIYDKTARPSDLDLSSSDARDLAASFDQLSVQPITDHVRMRFNPRNAWTRGSLGVGWAIDAADGAPGIWTLGQRAEVRLHIRQPAARTFMLAITAHGQAAIPEQQVSVAWNETVLGELVFTPKRSTQRLRVASDVISGHDTLTLGPRDPRIPATLDAGSNDTRALGLRVLKIELQPLR